MFNKANGKTLFPYQLIYTLINININNNKYKLGVKMILLETIKIYGKMRLPEVKNRL